MHEVGVRDPHLERVLHAALTLQQQEPAPCVAAPLPGEGAGSRSSV
jgi:hypothetical protein